MKRRAGSTIRREPPKARLLQDACRLAFFTTIAAAIGAVIVFLPRVHPRWLDVCGRALAAYTVHLVVVAILREIAPKPRVGSHIVGKNPHYVRWLIASAYTDVVNHPLVALPFSLFYVTRWLYLRAQGARIAFGASLPAGLIVREPCLFSMAPGSQVEPGVVIEAGVHATGRIRIDTVILGEGALVGAHSLLMPGVSLGHDVRVGPSVYIGPDAAIGVGAKIGERAILGAGVDLGSHVRIGVGAVIGEGSLIGDGAKVRAGAVIPPNTRIRAGEVWQSMAARPMGRDARSRSESA